MLTPLDNFALVSLFHKEPGWEMVRAALYEQQRAGAKALLDWVNWGEHAVSYADAFCIATARRLSGTVLTSDPEFHAVEHLITVRWLTA